MQGLRLLLIHHYPVLNLLVKLVPIEFIELLNLCHTILQFFLLVWIIYEYSITIDWLVVFLFWVNLFNQDLIVVKPMRILNFLIFQEMLLIYILPECATLPVMVVIRVQLSNLTSLVIRFYFRCLVKLSLISIWETAIMLLSWELLL